MAHKHEHNECEHELKHCKQCDEAYCIKCDKCWPKEVIVYKERPNSIVYRSSPIDVKWDGKFIDAVSKHKHEA